MATRTIANGGGNYNATGTWVEGAVPTNADDVVATATSGNLTVTAAAAAKSIDFTNYVGTFVINSSQTLTVSGNVTLVPGMTWTANTGTLAINAAGTLTSNGKAIPCTLTLTSAVTTTLGDNVTVNGNVNTGNNSTTTINGNTLTCAGGHNGSSRTAGTTLLLLTGGNITSNGQTTYTRYISNPVEIAGNVTLTNNYLVGAGTITYTSGTITWGGFSIQLAASQTMNGTWPSTTRLEFRQTSSTLTLGANQSIDTLSLNVNATLTLAGEYDLTVANTNANTTTSTIALNRSTHNFGVYTVAQGITGVFSGAYDFTLTDLRLRASGTMHWTSGQTMTVTNAFSICGCAGATTTLRATTGSSAATVTYSGTVDNLSIYRATITDVTFTNACYGYFSGTFTRTSGITDFTSNPSFYSDPGVANVLVGVEYKYNSQTNNSTGTFDEAARNTDPGAANVRTAQAYKIGNVSKSGTCAVPTAAQVLAGVSVDATTGTVALPTAAQVEAGVTFGAGSATTGTYDPVTGNFTDPGVANVKTGEEYIFDGDTLTGTYTVTAATVDDVKAAAPTITIPGTAPTPSDPPTAEDYCWAFLQGVVS